MIPEQSWQRLFDSRLFADDPVAIVIVLLVLIVLIASRLLIAGLSRFGWLDEKTSDELSARWRSWCWLGLLITAPIMFGAAYTIVAVFVLSLLCFHEFSRVTGIFRDGMICGAVVLGMVVTYFAVFDHWERLFFASAPLTIAAIAAVSIPLDRPKGYVQRVALGVFGYSLFGFSLAYLANLANEPGYRSILLMLILLVALNDVFAYCSGKLIGKKKLVPNTSPGKTYAGALWALFLTTVLTIGIGWKVFAGTPMQNFVYLAILGAMISVLGQLGDLMLSSIKRDVGLKDTGSWIPGHGGTLDRFDSLVLVPPAVFHYLSFVQGPLGESEPLRIFTRLLF